jgi:hypothetical protein
MGPHKSPVSVRKTLLDAEREVLILVGVALGISLIYPLVCGDWSVARIASTLQIAGVAVAAVGLLMAFGGTRRWPAGGVNATPGELTAVAHERTQARTHGFGTIAVAAFGRPAPLWRRRIAAGAVTLRITEPGEAFRRPFAISAR